MAKKLNNMTKAELIEIIQRKDNVEIALKKDIKGLEDVIKEYKNNESIYQNRLNNSKNDLDVYHKVTITLCGVCVVLIGIIILIATL